MDDNEIIKRASRCNNKFTQLYSGDWIGAGYGSQSEADIALCTILAFWTDANYDQIERIFSSSGLYRKKWERADYKSSTINRACANCKEIYSEYIKRKRLEEVNNNKRIYFQRW